MRMRRGVYICNGTVRQERLKKHITIIELPDFSVVVIE